MDSVRDVVMPHPLISLGVLVIVGVCTNGLLNVFNHALSRYPGPRLAAATTYWHAFVECILKRSFLEVLKDTHRTYGEVVRIGPNELHFSNPEAYHAIYRNKWDKEANLYHSFGEDRSSFGFLYYHEAKARKDVLNKTFSARAVLEAEGLVQEKVNELMDTFAKCSSNNVPVNASFAFRCFSMDVVTSLCFGKPIEAIASPDFKAPILLAMDASLEIFPRFKHFAWYKNMIMGCPPKISRVVSPATAGLLDLQESIRNQIDDLSDHPEHLENLTHKQTIFHTLMSPDAHKTGQAPSRGSLFEEAQALFFGGGDTTGNALTVTMFNLLKRPETYKKLKQEISSAWPNVDSRPSLRELEKLPYMDAVLREGLRLSSGVVGGLLRVVPDAGTTICGNHVPGGTIVSCGSVFVHYNADIFPKPEEFEPQRWIDSPELDHWLVAFSRGPRSCLGINLAWQEMRLVLATVMRKFDMSLEKSSPEVMTFREAFLPDYTSSDVKLWMKPVEG